MNDNVSIFISHATEDKFFARKLFNCLLKEGFQPWIDDENLSAGELWEDRIMLSIQKSRFVIACLSSLSVVKNGYIQKELRMALSEIEKKPYGQIYFIPILIDNDVELPYLRVGTVQLRDYHTIRVINDRDIDNLIFSLNKYINPNQEIVVEFNNVDSSSNWLSGKIKGDLLFFFKAKCFKDTGNGIDGGKVSKLVVWTEKPDSQNRVLINYDRGWDIMPHEVDHNVIPYYKILMKILDEY